MSEWFDFGGGYSWFDEWDIPDENPPDFGGGENPPDDVNPNDTSYDDSELYDYDPFDPWDIVKDLDDVDPSDIRGVSFETPDEVWEWLTSLGLEGFSDIVEIDDYYFPVVGDSDEVSS